MCSLSLLTLGGESGEEASYDIGIDSTAAMERRRSASGTVAPIVEEGMDKWSQEMRRCEESSAKMKSNRELRDGEKMYKRKKGGKRNQVLRTSKMYHICRLLFQSRPDNKSMPTLINTSSKNALDPKYAPAGSLGYEIKMRSSSTFSTLEMRLDHYDNLATVLRIEPELLIS